MLVLADEPVQCPASTSDRMRAALETALGKVPGARFVALRTRPSDAGRWFSQMLRDPGAYTQCHAAGPHDPPFARRTWLKANPSLDGLPDLEAAISSEAHRARPRPVPAGGLQGASAEPRDFDIEGFGAPGRRHVGAHRGRRAGGCPGGLGVATSGRWRCEACGAVRRLEVHHWRPLARGGAPFEPANLEVRCRRCHLATHHFPRHDAGWGADAGRMGRKAHRRAARRLRAAPARRQPARHAGYPAI